jgi:hypothetical protein
LRAENKELQQKLAKVINELEETNELNQALIVVNEEYGKENDNLYKKLELYKNIKRPKSIESRKRCKRSKSASSLNNDSNDNAHNITEINEIDKKKVRVCIVFFR